MFDDDDLEDEDTGPIRLWPAAVALGVAAIVAVVMAIVVLSGGGNDPGPKALPMRIVLAAAAEGGAVRVVTVAGACRTAVSATADLRADAVALSVAGREGSEPRGGASSCAADVAQCHALELSQAVGPRRLFPRPVSDPEIRAGAERLVAEGPCAPLPVEE